MRAPGSRLDKLVLILAALGACGPAAGSTDDGTGSTEGTQTGDETDGTDDTQTGDTGTDTDDPVCDKNVVLMGYWPPTNEMLRQWSTNEDQNPGEWAGEDWRGHGYDVYAFFPEFPPDGDPSNDQIGDEGAVGSPESDLRVDYQDTSEDFWRIVDTYQPVILITTSRGGMIGWEVEALEGGHGAGNPGDPAQDWTSDGHGAEHYPTQASTEARSWDAVSKIRKGVTLPSQLPLDAIVEATTALGLTTVQIDQTGTSGNFLSGFLGLHGLAYNAQVEHNVAAGHIHVGIAVPVADATQLIETTLDTVLAAHPVDAVGCPPSED